MPLPPDVVAARERMERADAALRADIESDQPYNRERRIELIDELQIAADEYVEKISRLPA
jgi:hypothetical protein